MATAPLIVLDRVSHHFGSGAVRKQILFEVSLEVAPGEVVILTGPSGSGKTTLLTLIGALRAAQDGSLRVLGQELREASEAKLVGVRRQIGYIFQLHNLVDALAVVENVETGLLGEPSLGRRQARERALEMLRGVGLAEHARKHPDQLSGGQKQRVAIARALVRRPRLILADEPTASLDRRSGRDVVDRIHDLAKQQGCAVVLVTHDNRILDIADRIVHLEEGRLSGFAEAVLASTQHLLGTLAKSNRAGELLGAVEAMSSAQFRTVVEQVTAEAQHLLQVLALGADDAFEIMLDEVLTAFTRKVGQLVNAERASILLADAERGELWSKVVQPEGGRPVEIRIPMTSGIAGYVYRTGEIVNVADAYKSALFNPQVDRETGYRTRSVLCTPVLGHGGRPFAVMSFLNKQTGDPFDARDEETLREFAASMGVLLQTWNETRAAQGRSTPHGIHEDRRPHNPG